MKHQSSIPSPLKTQLQQLPNEPGVYQFLNEAGHVVYIGKAKNLKNRVRSYFQNNANLEERKQEMVTKIHSLQTIVVHSEIDALVLEGTLIKRHKPKYNIKLKDSKSYQFIEIDHSQTFPGVEVVRTMTKAKAKYFGPFVSSWALQRTLKTLNTLFPYKTCTTNLDTHKRTICLDYHLGKCEGPCEQKITKEAYAKQIRRIEQFLAGQHGEIITSLQNEMRNAANERNFEYAAKIRDTIQAMKIIRKKQQVVLHHNENLDILAFASGNPPVINILRVREGYVLSRENIIVEHTEGVQPATVIEQFIQQYYSQNPNIPKQLLVEHLPESTPLLSAWLTQQKGSSVHITQPQRGDKKALVVMSAKNAAQYQKEQHHNKTRAIVPWPKTGSALKKQLKLQSVPDRIEAYDISNIQGNFAVGSMVVVEKGKPRPSDYKRFKIKAIPQGQANDFAMLQEVLSRRLKHAEEQHPQHWPLPNLFLIDGGTPQLRAVLKTFKHYNIEADIIGIAKKRPQQGKFHEELHSPNLNKPVRLPERSDELKLLTALRDEAHRFAISFYRERHGKATTNSVLDNIPGIGSKTKKILLDHFGSVEEIAKANQRQLVYLIGNTKTELLQKHLEQAK